MRARRKDVLVIGGGPAGLSAALLLGRCRRSVLVCDANQPRNRFTRAVHGFLTRDPISPRSLRAVAREQLDAYDVELREGCVSSLCRDDGGFVATLRDGATIRARKVLIATGLRDRLPEVPGLRDFYGRSAFHCPYCDGWELRDRPLAALGHGADGVALAHELRGWSEDVILFTNGRRLLPRARAKLGDIPSETARIARLAGRRGRLEAVVLEDGRSIPRRALFFLQHISTPAELEALGDTDECGRLFTGRLNETDVEGIWVAGDAARDVRFAIVAAAEGARAAYSINEALLAEERRARLEGARVTRRGSAA